MMYNNLVFTTYALFALACIAHCYHVRMRRIRSDRRNCRECCYPKSQTAQACSECGTEYDTVRMPFVGFAVLSACYVTPSLILWVGFDSDLRDALAVGASYLPLAPLTLPLVFMLTVFTWHLAIALRMQKVLTVKWAFILYAAATICQVYCYACVCINFAYIILGA